MRLNDPGEATALRKMKTLPELSGTDWDRCYKMPRPTPLEDLEMDIFESRMALVVRFASTFIACCVAIATYILYESYLT